MSRHVAKIPFFTRKGTVGGSLLLLEALLLLLVLLLPLAAAAAASVPNVQALITLPITKTYNYHSRHDPIRVGFSSTPPVMATADAIHPLRLIGSMPTIRQPQVSTTRISANKAPDDNHVDSTTPGSIVVVATTSLWLLVTWISCAGVFWSEVAVYQTGCGPLSLPDLLERGCYLGVLVVSGLSVFLRMALQQSQTDLVVLPDPTSTSNNESDSNTASILRLLLQSTEILAIFAVVGAVVVLGNQMVNGETMDGLSGIDLEKCRARQSFSSSME